MIAIERYIALHNIENFSRHNFFKTRISFVVFISGFLAIFCSLLVSVYQKVDSRIIFIGICLKSEFLVNNMSGRIIYILITSLFVLGLTFVSIVYVIIFIKTYKLIIRHMKRKTSEIELFKRVTQNTLLKTMHTDEIKNTKADKNIFKMNENVQLVVVILFVTFIYYLSIIPWCLTMNSIIQFNAYIHYLFLLNNTVNPIVYGFLNPYFRSSGFYLLKIKFNSA